MHNSIKDKCTVCILPDGRFLPAHKGELLLEALVAGGILLRAVCGGKGLCGKCLVRISPSSHAGVSPPADAETSVVGATDLKAGYRLACKTRILNDVSVQIPASSLASPHTVQKGPVLLPEQLSFFAPPVRKGAGRYGLAIDLGTTTIAVYVGDLVSGNIAGSIAVRNPQSLFGDDVLGRISFAAEGPEHLSRLQKMAVQAIEWSIKAVCRSTRVDPWHISSAVVAGNTTMIHLFAGVNPSSIGVFPYTPCFIDDRTFKAGSIGFAFNPSADIFTMPLISGFLGSDIVAAALATELDNAPAGTMLADIGTNGEVMLKSEEGLLATSCATGTAFEAAAIRHGMQAVSGAIDAVKIDRGSGRVICSVIHNDAADNCLASGICGSGIVSATAEIYRAGLISRNGRLNGRAGSPLIRRDQAGQLEFELVPAHESQTGRAITLTQADIRAVQLAKGALSTGIKMLCAKAGLTAPKRLLVAGAFGNFIDKKAALAIGMFPDLHEDCIAVAGNAAGTGALLTLFNPALRDKAEKLARAVKVLDLASRPEFQELFLSSLSFPELS